MCTRQSMRPTRRETAKIELPHTQTIRQLIDILRPIDQATAWFEIWQTVSCRSTAMKRISMRSSRSSDDGRSNLELADPLK